MTTHHLVSARATANHLTLGRRAVADKSNEITAIPELLRILALKGALVTVGAAGGQTEIARRARTGGGDSLLAVKGNQPARHAVMQAVFDRTFRTDLVGVEYDKREAAEGGHGRHEERSVTVIYTPQGLPAGRRWQR